MKKIFAVCLFFYFIQSQAQMQNMNSACEQNPCQALPICATVVTNPYSYQSNTGNAGIPTNGCGNSVGGTNDFAQNWNYYQFTCQSSGTFNFTITSNDPQGDFDWALWDVTSSGCSGISSSNLIECNSFVGTGTTGIQSNPSNGFEPTVNILFGNTYILGISRRNGGTSTTPPSGPPFANGSSGFSINFSGTASIVNSTYPALEAVEPFDSSIPVTQLILKLNQKVRCFQVGAGDFSFTGGGTVPSFTASGGSNCPGCTGTTGFNWSNVSDKITINFSSPLPAGNYTISLVGVNPFSTLCGVPSNTAVTLPLTIANLSNPTHQLNKYNYFPNPVHTNWTIQSNNPMQKLRFYTINGKFIKELIGNETNYTIDLSDWKSGIYFVKIETNSQVKVLKIVKD